MKLRKITSISLLALATLAIPATMAHCQEHGWIFDRDHVIGRTVSDAHGTLAGSINGELVLEDQPAALVLNGETTHVSVEQVDESMLPERNISAEAWVLLNTGTRWGGIMGYLQDNGDFERGWVLGYDNDDFVFGVSTDNDITYMDSPDDFTPGAWHHVVGTYDGSTMRLYVDGELVETSGARSGDIDYSDASFTLGAYVDDNEFWGMDGKIHEANLYATTLGDEEIRERYLAKRNLFLGDDANPGDPGNPGDPCDEIQEIVEGTYTGDTTDSPGIGSASCGNSNDSPARIYLYRPGSDGRLTVSTCDSSFDTALSVHSTCPPVEGNQVECNDDTCELQSSVSIDVTSGTAYIIRVSGYNNLAGEYTLSVELDDGTGQARADAVVSDVTGIEHLLTAYWPLVAMASCPGGGQIASRCLRRARTVLGAGHVHPAPGHPRTGQPQHGLDHSQRGIRPVTKRDFHNASSYSSSHTLSCTIPPPTPICARPMPVTVRLRMATLKSARPSGPAQPMAPQ